MKKTLLYSMLSIAGYLLVLSLGAGHSAGAAAISSCGCHPTKAEKQFTHKPVRDGECESCHKPSGQRHPKVKKEAFLLTDDGKVGLCNECHERKDIKKYVHGPVGSGDCLACHDVHQSNNVAQLKEPPARLCFMCHERTQFDRKHSHPPIADGNCTGCHDPHQSDVKFMLKGEGAKLCIICHDKAMFTGKSIHKPVADGDCNACHATHGTENPRLLRGYFAEDFYMPFDKRNFALCFGCHNDKMADDKLTDTQTGFRNGLDNTHYIHINKLEKGRSCKVCHDPHAASQRRLISATIAGFGRWGIPIRFTKTETGGTCIVGCHKPKSYDRVNAIINP